MRRLVLISAAAAVLVAGLVPVLVLVAQSLSAEAASGFSYFRTLVSSGRAWTLAGHSLALASLTTALTLIIGVPLGVLLGKSNLPARQLLLVTLVIPLVIPPYVLAVSWSGTLGPGGVLARLLPSALAGWLSASLFGLSGCVLVLTTTFLPIIVLITMAQLAGVRATCEEAGRLVSDWRGVLWHITLPMIMPGISFAAVLVFLLSLGEFGVPIFLRFEVFPVESFAQFSAFYNFPAATAAALPLGLVTLLLLWLEHSFVSRAPQSITSALGEKPAQLPLEHKTTFLLLIAVCELLLIVLPLGVLVVGAVSPGALAEAIDRSGASLGRSILYAACGATGLTVLGLLCGYSIHAKAIRFWRGLDFIMVFLFALPGPVIGIGLIGLWNRSLTGMIYASPVIILLAYLAQYTALTARLSASALGSVPRSMEEAAQVSGAHWGRRFTRITVPLISRSLVVAWLVGYLFCLRDTGMTMLVYPPGHDTLPVRTFTLMANGRPEMISALCVLMIAAALVPLLILAFTSRTVRVA